VTKPIDPGTLQQIEALLGKARHYAGVDPEVSLGQMRKAAEAIARAVFAREIGDPGKIMLDALLQKLAAAKAVPAGVLIPFGTIQAYGNYGVHAQADSRAGTAAYVAPAIAALEEVARWFHVEYLGGDAGAAVDSAGSVSPLTPPGAQPRERSKSGPFAGVALALVAVAAAGVFFSGMFSRNDSRPPVHPPEDRGPARQEAPGGESSSPAGAPGAQETGKASPLTLDFTVTAQRPDESPRTLHGGEELFEGAGLVFRFRVSAPAHLYLCQRSSATGQIQVLFPDERIPLKNPVPGGEWVRIPAGDRTYRLDNKDLGTETVFVVASPTPLERLDQALEGLRKPGAGGSGEVAAAEHELLALSVGDRPDCVKTKGLSLDVGGVAEGDCGVRTKGIALDEEPARAEGAGATAGAPKASRRLASTAANPLIFVPFSFKHVPVPR